MRIVLNAIWLVFAGVWLALLWALVGIALCVSIIGIAFGMQAFKIAGFVLWPFGRTLVKRQGAEVREASAVGNVIWVVLAGWWLALLHLVVGICLIVSIVGIPLGLGVFKMVPITFAPFGREIVAADAPAEAQQAHAVPTRWEMPHPTH
ncbi:MAG TPA: YccF domain-containing protein [Solirubrobacteraceae bacterium]|nr:YccF domain-containing protein [Solirubrobacteraceae bacterium]